jgi:hypothetical protein
MLDLTKKKRKGPEIYDFQLFDVARLTTLNEKETILSLQKHKQLNMIRELRLQAKNAPSINDSCARADYVSSLEGIHEQIDRLQNSHCQYELPPEDHAAKDEITVDDMCKAV